MGQRFWGQLRPFNLDNAVFRSSTKARLGKFSPGDDTDQRCDRSGAQPKDATNKWSKIGQIYDDRQGRIVKAVIVVCTRES